MMKLIRKRFTLLDLYRLFLGCSIFEGALVLWHLFRIPSETRNIFLFNFSLQRLALGFAILLIIGILIILFFDSLSSQKFLKFLAARFEILLRFDILHVIIKTSLIMVILVCSLAIILFYPLPYLQRLLFFIFLNNAFPILGERFGFLIGWILLTSLEILILYSASGRRAGSNLSIPIRLMIVSWTSGVFLIGLFILWSLVAGKALPEPFIGPGIKILILSLWLSVWALLNKVKKWADRLFQLFVCISIGLFFFIVSMQLAQWLNNWGPDPRNMFILLAYSFLHGKLYILPTLLKGTHDLVLNNQHWYVAFPPFPVILMLPFVAIWGIHSFNYTAFSVVVGSLAGVVIYLILDQLIRLGWVKLSRSGAIWLTSLFSFGTVFWWLSIHVSAGFLCHVVSVLACGLAFLSALKKYSPWVTGAFLAMAILCRPNIFVLWPALLAITIQQNLNGKKVNWSYLFRWSVLSAIPVILGVGLLLYYNFVRFGNFFDFGYATLNGSEFIIENVQNYGVWSLHYVPFNLHSMFVAWPQLIAQCKYYLPRGNGMSILMTSPALIYVLRKFKITWWTGGCWFSILLSIALLAMYSNNGAIQYGYRYVMDFIIPVIMLIAFNVGGKVSWFLKTLIIASVIINYYGLISWFYSPC